MLGVLRRLRPALLVGLISMSAWAGEKQPEPNNAARLNNLGVAYMNQQRMDKAVEEFDLALKADPGLTAAELNKGIALLNLQKLPEAEAALNTAGSQGTFQSARLVQPRSIAAQSRQAGGSYRRIPARPQDRSQRSRHALFPGNDVFAATAVSPRPSPSSKPCCVCSRCMRRRSLDWHARSSGPAMSDAAREHLQTFEHLTKSQSLLAHDPHLWRAGPLLDRAGSHYAGAEGRADDSGDVRRAVVRPRSGVLRDSGKWLSQAVAFACWM